MTDFFRGLFSCFHRSKPEEELKFAARQLYQMVKYNKIIQDAPRYALPKYKLGYMVPINTPQEENVANNLYDKDLDILQELKDLSDNELQRKLQISFLNKLSEDSNPPNTAKEGVPVKKKEGIRIYVESVREIKNEELEKSEDAYDSPLPLSELLITSQLIMNETARKKETDEKDEKEEKEEEEEEREQDERQINSTNLEENETKERELYTSETTSESLESSESSNAKQDDPQEDKTIEDTSQNHGQTETPPSEDNEIKKQDSKISDSKEHLHSRINITESINTKEDKHMKEMQYERNVETIGPEPIVSEEDEPRNDDYTVEDKTTFDQENPQFEFILLFKKNTSNKTELSNNKLTSSQNLRNESSVQLNGTETDEYSKKIQNIAERESEAKILRISTDLLDSTKYSNKKLNEDIEYLRKKRLASGQLSSHKSLNFEETLYLSSLSGETMAQELHDIDRRLDAGEIPKADSISQTSSVTSTIESEDSENKSEYSENKSEDSESSNQSSKFDFREILKQAQAALIPKSEVFINFSKTNKNILKRPDDYGLTSDDSISVREMVIDAYKIKDSDIEQSNIRDIPGKSEDSGYETDPKDHAGTSAKVIKANDGEVLQGPVQVICACNIDSEKLQTLTTSEIIELSRRNTNNNRISCVSCKCGNATKSNKQSTKKTENDANEGQSSSTNNRTTNERKSRKS